MSRSSEGEQKSGDGEQRSDHDEPTDPEMPTLTEDPLPPGGGDPRQDEEAGTTHRNTNATGTEVPGVDPTGWTYVRTTDGRTGGNETETQSSESI